MNPRVAWWGLILSCCVAYLGVVSSLSLVSVMYVPTQSQLQELDLQTLMWGDNAQNWERLHVTVTLETKKLTKSGCEYGVSLLPVDNDGFPIEIETGQLRELGCATQICAFVDGVKVCDVNENPESDFEVDTVMGKCHMSIPTALAYSTINTKRFVGLNATWLHSGGSSSGNYTCEITHLDDMTLTVTLEPFTAMYDCEDNFFWSHRDEECKPCQNEDILSLCPPGHFVRGCDALAHVGESYCSPCENTPDNFDAGFYAWHPTSECVLECMNNQQYQYFMNGTICSPCTQSLRSCSEDPENNCCAKTPGKMWQACTSSQNEQCVDCPEILKLQYSQNEVHIPWTSDCESYFIQSFYTLPKEPPYCECQTTCIDNHYRSLTIPNVPCVPCSTGQELLLTAETSAEAGETYKFQQCTKASNTQILQCDRKELGCDGIPYSGKVFDVCDVCGGDNTTCTGCDGVVASGKENDECGICDGDSTTCQGCDGVPNSGLVEDVCGQCGGDNTSCWGCDNVSNSGLVFDACGECGGDGSSCWGCDNVSNSELVFDACHVCGGDNTTCTGCDGVLFSGKVFDSCGVCDGGDQAQDSCGVCYGDNTSCVGCDGILKSGIFNDSCGVCGGDNSTCAGCDGIPYSGKIIDSCDVCGGDNTTCIGCDGIPKSGVFNDSCGVCGGDNSTCAGCDGIPYSGIVNDSCNVCGGDNTCVGCDGIPYSGKVFDFCNVCGGDNTTSECHAGYTGPQCGMLSDSCAPCGPGTYKDVIGSSPCIECPFHTYNPEYGSTSSAACLQCMENSETEEIYGHESIHACMCISGYYHDTHTSCSACMPGTFNGEKNRTQCSNCSAGYHSNGPNSSTCEICPNGTYSHEGSALCTPCNLNASSPEGSDSIGACVCDVGFHFDIIQQFGEVSTEVASGALSGPIKDVELATNGQWAVVVDNYDVKHVNLMSPAKTITTIGSDVYATGICLNSDSTKLFFRKNTGEFREYSMPADPNLVTVPTYNSFTVYTLTNSNFFSQDPPRGDCSVTIDGHLIVTDWYDIHEVFTSSGLHTKTYNIGATYASKIMSLTVTGENDNIILYIHNAKVWMIDRGGTSWVQLPTSGSGWNINQFNEPSSLTMSNDRQTVYFVTTTGIGAIDYVTGSVSTVAGHDVTTTTGDDGCTDGTRNEATFDMNTFTVTGMSVSPDGMYLLVPGYSCNNIRRVDLVTQVTSHCVDCTTRALSCRSNTYLVNCGGNYAGTCTQCASCPNGQYRQNCSLHDPGVCVDCATCPSGQYRQNCSLSDPGVCVDCATCPSGQYRQNCSLYDPGVCVDCATCPSGQYRQNCSLYDPGVCVDCATCPTGQYLQGCSEVSAGTCVDCATCLAGEERVNCTDSSAGMCVACPTGTYKVNVSAQPCQPCPSCPQNSTSMGCGGANAGSCVVIVANPDAEGITTTLLGTFGQSGCPSVGDVGSAVKFQQPTAAIGLPNDLAAVADSTCQMVLFFDLNDNSVIWTGAMAGSPYAFCKSPSGDVLYVVDQAQYIRKVDMTADTYSVTDLAHYSGKSLTGCAVTSDGANMIISYYGGIFEVAINNPTITLVTYTGMSYSYGVTLSADDSTIFFSHQSWGRLYKITHGDANSMTPWANTIGGKQAKSILISADGTFAYVKTAFSILKVPVNGATVCGAAPSEGCGGVTTLIGTTDYQSPGYSDTPGSELFYGHTFTMGYVENGMYFLVSDLSNKVIRKVSTGLDGVRTIT